MFLKQIPVLNRNTKVDCSLLSELMKLEMPTQNINIIIDHALLKFKDTFNATHYNDT